MTACPSVPCLGSSLKLDRRTAHASVGGMWLWTTLTAFIHLSRRKNGSTLPRTARSGGRSSTIILSLVMSPPSQSIIVLAGRRVAAPAISSATNFSAGCRQISPFDIIAYGNAEVQVQVCMCVCVCVCVCMCVYVCVNACASTNGMTWPRIDGNGGPLAVFCRRPYPFVSPCGYLVPSVAVSSPGVVCLVINASMSAANLYQNREVADNVLPASAGSAVPEVWRSTSAPTPGCSPRHRLGLRAGRRCLPLLLR